MQYVLPFLDRRYGFSKHTKQDKVSIILWLFTVSHTIYSFIFCCTTLKEVFNVMCILQAEEKKLLSAQGGQSLPPGMTEVSEEEDLQAAEEVSYAPKLWCVYTSICIRLTINNKPKFGLEKCLFLQSSPVQNYSHPHKA